MHLRVLSRTSAGGQERAPTAVRERARLGAMFTRHGLPLQAGAGLNSHSQAPVPHLGTCHLSSHTCLCVPLGMHVHARISVPLSPVGHVRLCMAWDPGESGYMSPSLQQPTTIFSIVVKCT